VPVLRFPPAVVGPRNGARGAALPGIRLCSLQREEPGADPALPWGFRCSRSANQAIAIPDEEIHAMKAMVQSTFSVVLYAFLNAGQKLRIEWGPLAGVRGIIVEIKKEFRLAASITLLQRLVSVEVDREWVAPVPSPNRGASICPGVRPLSNLHACT